MEKGSSSGTSCEVAEYTVECEIHHSKTMYIKNPSYLATRICKCEIHIPNNNKKNAHMQIVEKKHEYWFRISMEHEHPNILRTYTILPIEKVTRPIPLPRNVEPSEDLCQLYTEPITGYVGYLMEGQKIFSKLPDIIKSYLDVIDYLHRNDLYHGDICMHLDFYFQKDEEADPILKMAHFKQEEVSKSLKDLQKNDWTKFGKNLKDLIKLFKAKDYIRLDELDQLARFLIAVKYDTLGSVKEKALRLPYFMEKNDRVSFMVVELPYLLKNREFVKKVDKQKDAITTFPWHINFFDEHIVHAMDNYNPEGRQPKPYDKGSVLSFLQFISGVYTHIDELNLPPSRKHTRETSKRMAFDKTLAKDYPKLLLMLKEMQAKCRLS